MWLSENVIRKGFQFLPDDCVAAVKVCVAAVKVCVAAVKVAVAAYRRRKQRIKIPISWHSFSGNSTRKTQSCPEKISVCSLGSVRRAAVTSSVQIIRCRCRAVCMVNCGLRAAFVWLCKPQTIEDHVLYHAAVVSRCTR